VDVRSEHFLTGAGLAEQQNRRVRRCDAGRLRLDELDCGAPADDAVSSRRFW
jgi:hypothetical protein